MGVADNVQLIAVGIQTVAIIFGGITVVARTSAATKQLQRDLKAMEEELKDLAKVVTAQAVQAQRLDDQSRRMTMLEQRIEEMRRGKGYVQERVATSVDREY